MGSLSDKDLQPCTPNNVTGNGANVGDTGYFGQCGPFGDCLKNPINSSEFICLCNTYYDPKVNCSLNYYQTASKGVQYTLLVAEYIATTILFILYSLEIIAIIRMNGWKGLKNVSGVIKILVITYTIGKYISTSFRAHDTIWETTQYTQPTVYTKLILLNIIVTLYLLSCIEWQTLLISAVKLGFNPRPMTIVRIILWVTFVVGVPIATLSAILERAKILVPVTKPLVTIATVFCIIIPLFIVIVYSVKTFNVLAKMLTDSGVEGRLPKRLAKVRRKTIYLCLSSAVFIINTIILTFMVASGNLTIQTNDVIMFQNVSNSIYEFLIAILLWNFLANYSSPFPMRYLLVLKSAQISSGDDTTPQISSQSQRSRATTLSRSGTETVIPQIHRDPVSSSPKGMSPPAGTPRIEVAISAPIKPKKSRNV